MNDFLIYKLSARKGFILSLILSLILNILIFRDIVWNPGKYIFNDHDDGIKNYYTVYYHAVYDHSAFWFGGMNYPEGDHILFTDNQPIIGETLRVFVQDFGMSPEYIPGILNFLMIFSLVFCTGMIWLCFWRLGYNHVYFLLASLVISNLNPQLARIIGHYALFYSFVIPAALFLWLSIYQTKKKIWYIFYAFYIILITFIHLYYGLILLFLIAGLSITTSISDKSWRKNTILDLGITVFPLVAVKIFLKFTDPIQDRPDSPFGFLFYRSQWESIFLPLDHFPANFINRVIKIRQIEWEGIAYVGIPATVFFAIFLFFFLKSIYKKSNHEIWTQFSTIQKVMFIAGLGNLLFAMGIPFIFWLEWLVPYLGPLKQFRSIGRFSWNFYYLINILTFLWIFLNWQKGKIKNYWAYSAILILAFQIYDYRKYTYRDFANPSSFNENGYLTKIIKDLKIKKSDYQAIWPVPYFHVGSEKVNRNPNCYTPTPVLGVSWITGIPTNGVVLSRTSYSQTIEKIGFHENSDSLNVFLNKLSNKKPFLIVQVKRDCPINSSDSVIISKSKRLYANIDPKNPNDSLIIYHFQP